jgi:hypothetical protein
MSSNFNCSYMARSSLKDLNVIFYQNMPNLHNLYKSAERKISQKNPEHMLDYSLPCSCSKNLSSFWFILKQQWTIKISSVAEFRTSLVKCTYTCTQGNRKSDLSLTICDHFSELCCLKIQWCLILHVNVQRKGRVQSRRMIQLWPWLLMSWSNYTVVRLAFYASSNLPHSYIPSTTPLSFIRYSVNGDIIHIYD